MFFILIFIFLSFFYSSEGLSNGTISTQPHPYFVNLVTPRLCGGVLISLVPETWILTAAHCVSSGNGSFVTSGLVHYGTKKQQFYHTVVVHPIYKKLPRFYGSFQPNDEEEKEETVNATIYDVALIKLDHAIITPTTSTNNDSYSSIYYNSIGKKLHHHNPLPTVQTIPIATVNNNTSSNTECMGKGATSLNPGSESFRLMTAECTPTNDSRTIGIFGPYLDAVQVIQAPSSVSLCHGDSGGPLVMNKEVHYLSGILSRILYAYDPNPDQPACPVPESPDDLPMVNVFVKPSFHLTWISQTTSLSIQNLTTPPPSPYISPSASYFDILHYNQSPTTFPPFVGWLFLVILCSYLLF